jgi:hypothetical protein
MFWNIKKFNKYLKFIFFLLRWRYLYHPVKNGFIPKWLIQIFSVQDTLSLHSLLPRQYDSPNHG